MFFNFEPLAQVLSHQWLIVTNGDYFGARNSLNAEGVVVCHFTAADDAYFNHFTDFPREPCVLIPPEEPYGSPADMSLCHEYGRIPSF